VTVNVIFVLCYREVDSLRGQTSVLRSLRHGIIVSCQVEEGDLLCRPDIMAAMAVAAERGGAAAVRVRSPEHIRATKDLVTVPVIGLTKRSFPRSLVYITPTWADVAVCLEAGADIVALDATDRPRPSGLPLIEIVSRARAVSDALLMADVSSQEEGERAAELGFDLVSTTLAGYTESSALTSGPDLALVGALARGLSVPIVAEGRFTAPGQVAEALARGAWAVCIGKAITDPGFITARFVAAVRSV
jgi:N-acylglucosamine-6-phosphate 2-epimerase